MMSDNGGSNFLYLNRGNAWLDFDRVGLDLSDDGTLRLAALPLLEGDLPAGLAGLAAPLAPAGLAFFPDGSAVWTDPDDDRVLRTDCLGGSGPWPSAGGRGDRPTQFREPRGVLYHRLRRALFVADTGNSRLQVFDPETSQLLAVWSGLNRPWALADDLKGNVYVVSDSPDLVQAFDLQGNLLPAFGAAVLSGNPGPQRPVAVVVDESAGGTEVFLLDAGARAVLAYDGSGALLRRIDLGAGAEPMGLAVGGGSVYVGDNAGFRLRRYGRGDGVFIGDGEFGAPIAVLTFDGAGRLAVVSGGATAPVRLATAGAFVKRGFLWTRARPLPDPSFRPSQWHWLRATAAPPPEGAHLRLAFATSAGGPAPPTDPDGPAPPWGANACDLADLTGGTSGDGRPGRWVVVPWDAENCVFPGTPGAPVWVGVEFIGEGRSSPSLSQLRIDFDHNTYLQYLPNLYTRDPVSGPFLARFLTLIESLFAEAEADVAGLPALFDPWAAPAAALDWVGGLLALDLPEDWPPARKRLAVASAFAADARRGTAAGLEAVLRETLGVVARVEEPILQAGWWALPGDAGGGGGAGLGFNTMLAAYEPQGAVVGTSAVLDGSQLVDDADYGAGLFRDLAHRFSVRLYRGAGGDGPTLAAVRGLIDREKPAHTTYEICVVEPRMSVGFQARVGVDTVVAGPGPPDPRAGVVLGGPEPGRIGPGSRVGRTTVLGAAAVDS
jgi:phage tail-like protein